jgi:hypothetical protein
MLRSVARVACATVLVSILSGLPLRAASAQARWTVATVPSLIIGSDTSATDFLTTVVGATRLPNGSILVGDRGDHALVLFDTKGALTRKFARKGRGPGEIVDIATDRFLRCGNRIAVLDSRTQQVSLFALDGTYQSRFRFARLPYRLMCNDSARFVMYEWERDSDMQEGVYRPFVPYWITRADSTKGVSLGSFPASERFGQGPLALGREPRVALSSSRAYVALADSMHILVFDLAGKALPPLRASYRPIASTPADWNEELERWIALVGERMRPQAVNMFRDMPRPRFLPATRDLIVDAQQQLWVQHFPRAAEPLVNWTVFAPNGQVRATAQLPTRLEVYEIGTDYVLGRYVNPDTDVPEVRLYKLTGDRHPSQKAQQPPGDGRQRQRQ